MTMKDDSAEIERKKNSKHFLKKSLTIFNLIPRFKNLFMSETQAMTRES